MLSHFVVVKSAGVEGDGNVRSVDRRSDDHLQTQLGAVYQRVSWWRRSAGSCGS